MKQLTQAEFDALGDGPHDARIVGSPCSDAYVLVWIYGYWDRIYTWDDRSLQREGFERHPIWHKLPADYVEPQ